MTKFPDMYCENEQCNCTYICESIQISMNVREEYPHSILQIVNVRAIVYYKCEGGGRSENILY